MKKHENIIQGTQDWFAIKWKKIGGTRAKGLFVKSDTLLIELASEFTEEFELEDSYISQAMERGNDLEPEARQELSNYLGLEFKEYGWLQSNECDLLGISPDGLTEDETIACEIKCPSRKKHLQYILDNQIPSDYLHQCIHYFTVNSKLEKLYFCSYRPESIKPLFIKEMNRDTEINLGTKAKTIYKTVNECAKFALKEAKEIKKQIDEIVYQLSF